MIKIPILYTTYNRLKYTKITLPALIENTGDIGSVFIIDNNSTDGTREFLEKINVGASIVEKVIFNEKNIGVSGAMNQFFDIIPNNSEYFAKVDNDTIVPANWLETLLSALKVGGVDIIQAKHFFIHHKAKDWEDLIRISKSEEVLGANLIHSPTVGGSGIVASAKTINVIDESLGLFGWSSFQRNSEDYKSAFYDGVTVDVLDLVGYNRLKLSDLDYHVSVGRTDVASTPNVSIVIPVIRPESAKKCIEKIKENAGIESSLYEIITEEDKDRIGCPKILKSLTEKAKYDLVMFLGDDTEPEPEFLVEAISSMSQLPDGWGLVALNDGMTDGNKLATHWLAHKKLLDHTENREFFYTGYDHQFCDNELTDIAKGLGRYIYSDRAKIKHNHPIKDRAFEDEDYARVYSKEVERKDQKLYMTRKKARGYFKLGIGFPLTDIKVYTSFLASWTAMEKGSFTFLMPTFPGQIEAIRNDIVIQALRENCTHLLMMDTDQNYPSDAIPKLLSHKKDVVAASVHRRYPPFDMIMLRGELGAYHHVPDDECFSGKLIEVDAIGCACMLFNTDVFLDIPHPWFNQYRMGDGRNVGEDIDFCSKMRKQGYRIFVDTSISIGHISTVEINKDFYLLYKKVKGFEWRPPPEEANQETLNH